MTIFKGVKWTFLLFLVFSQHFMSAQEYSIQGRIFEEMPELIEYEIELKLVHEREAKISKHYTYELYFNDLLLYNNFIKVSTDWEGQIINLQKKVYSLKKLDANMLKYELNLWKERDHSSNHFPNKKVQEKLFGIFPNGDQLETVQILNAWGTTYDQTKIVSLENEVLASWNHVSKAKIDTVVSATVFVPDPITSLNINYYDTLTFVEADNNDADQSWLMPAYNTVSFPAVYDDVLGKFVLENKYLKLDDVEGPTNIVATENSPNFLYNRSQTGFEECMVMYHVSEFQKHINLLGYDSLMDLQLTVDAHGQFNQDNSIFNRNGGSPEMIFGDGGVDDAEDADVIIHEYSHGISWDANANTNFGFERNALDEGIGDYFATSYSRSISPFRYADMFTWDGHNEFWVGRTAASTQVYDAPFAGNFYALGSVWNTAMQSIYTDLGRNTTDELMLETLYFLSNNSTLPEVAHLMLKADTLLNGGANVGTLCSRFQEKNILDASCLPVSVSDQPHPENSLKVYNSFGFSQNREALRIEVPNGPFHNQLYDIGGRLLRSEKVQNGGTAVINPSGLPAGLYILKIRSEHQVYSIKLSLR